MDYKAFKYRQYNLFLLGGFILFLIIGYYLSFSETLHLYQENNDYEQKLEEASSAPRVIAESKMDLKVLDAQMKAYAFDSIINQEYLLAEVSNFCSMNKVIFQSFPHYTVQEEKDFTIHTNNNIAEGTFSNLLKLVYHIEQVVKIGRIASVQFLRKQDKKTKRVYLTAKIHVQSIQLK